MPRDMPAKYKEVQPYTNTMKKKIQNKIIFGQETQQTALLNQVIMSTHKIN